MKENISKHITYREATNSHGAVKAGVDNTPTTAELEAMKLVATTCFEPLREHVNHPIKIESFLRKHTNRSQHYKGEAIDIDNDFGGSNRDMFVWLADNTVFDQLIWEFGNSLEPGWIHVSHREGRNRGRLTVAYKNNGTQYRHFENLTELNEFLQSFYR